MESGLRRNETEVPEMRHALDAGEFRFAESLIGENDLRKLEMPDDYSGASQYVYVLSNESMPGMYKVGMTTSSPIERMNQLYTTGVPTPFNLEVSIAVIEALDSERLAHKALVDYRVSGRREFFKGDMAEIVATVLSAIDLFRIDYVRRPEVLADVNKEIAKQAENKVEFRKWLGNRCLDIRNALARLEGRLEKLREVQSSLKKSGIPEAEHCCSYTYTDGSSGQNGPGFVMLDIRSSTGSLKDAIEEIEAAMQDQGALDKMYERNSKPKSELFSHQLGREARNYESDFRQQLFVIVEDKVKRRKIREALDKFGIHTASGYDPEYGELEFW
jgi:hypothetical protein